MRSNLQEVLLNPLQGADCCKTQTVLPAKGHYAALRGCDFFASRKIPKKSKSKSKKDSDFGLLLLLVLPAAIIPRDYDYE